jgi:hypothetical protein
MAITGEKRWPPVGRKAWPLTDPIALGKCCWGLGTLPGWRNSSASAKELHDFESPLIARAAYDDAHSAIGRDGAIDSRGKYHLKRGAEALRTRRW